MKKTDVARRSPLKVIRRQDGLVHKARYTLLTNNDEIRTYSEQCIVGVHHVSQTGFSLYPVRRLCIEVVVSSMNTKEFLVKKKRNSFVLSVANMFVRKLMANNEQCIAAHSPCFHKQYFVRQKMGFLPYYLQFANRVQRA